VGERDDLADRLAVWLSTDGVAPGLAGPVEVTSLDRLSGGASRQSFAATLRCSAVALDVVVQRKRRGALGAAMTDEAELVRAAGAAGVPVADVLAATDDPGPLGGGAMVVRRVGGEALAQAILRSEDLAAARRCLVADAAAALAAVGRIDPGTAGLGWLRDDDPLDLLEVLHRGLGRHQPVIELALRWLAANRPAAPTAPRVVHGDFRLGNLIVEPDSGRLAAVLDWELAHLGDPAEDLAWACVKAWRFGSSSPVMGVGDVDEWLASYGAAGGDAPDVDRFRWWLVYGTLRWAVICELQAAAHLGGMVDSVELAVLGRRVAESEHDLLGLLGMLPADGPPPTTPPAGWSPPDGVGGAPHDEPSVDELLAAVERFLAGTVVDASGGQVRFHAKVAANAVGIVRRQLDLGDAAAIAHRNRLASLGFDDDTPLAAAIAAGDLDDRLDEVGGVLAGAVVDKLAVANPSYLDSAPADPWATDGLADGPTGGEWPPSGGHQ